MELPHRKEDNIKNVKEKGYEGMDWSPLAQKRNQCQAFVNMVLNFCVSENKDNFFNQPNFARHLLSGIG
jgi:hypothetical protein